MYFNKCLTRLYEEAEKSLVNNFHNSNLEFMSSWIITFKILQAIDSKFDGCPWYVV